MSAATPRTISNAPDLRQFLAVVGVLMLAVALVVAVIATRQVSLQGATSAVPASVAHDHGWSSTNGSRDLIVGDIQYTGIPYPGLANPTGLRGLVISTNHGGILYTGIPYPAPESNRDGGSNGTRFAQ